VNLALWFSYALLWIFVIVLALLVLLLYRQFGLAYMSGQRRISMQGLDVGARASSFSLVSAVGEPHRVLWGDDDGPRPRLVVFGAPACAVCDRLSEDVAFLPREWPHVEFVWVDREDGGQLSRSIDQARGWLRGVAAGDAAHREWDVSAVPFAFVVSAEGEILRKRLVNTRDDVRELLAIVTGSTAMPSTAEVLQ
jgi:methylamine dehydrogenase accessory protein MauD